MARTWTRGQVHPFGVFGTAGVAIYLEPGNQGQQGPGVSGRAGVWGPSGRTGRGEPGKPEMWGLEGISAGGWGGDVEARGLASFSELALCSVPWEAGT